MTTTDTAAPRGLTAAQLELLLAPLHPGRVRHLKSQSHLEAWDVRRWLTRIFGFGGWSDEILSCQLVHEQTWPVTDDHGKPVPGKNRCTAVYRVTLRLIVKDDWGNEIGRWDDGATGDSVNQPSVGDAHDMALKTALSQALKRCAVNLGDQFGLSLYNEGATAAVVVRTMGHSTVAPSQGPADADAPVVGGELDEPREALPELTVEQAVEKMRRNQQQPEHDPWATDATPAEPDQPRPSTEGQWQKLAILVTEKRGVPSADRGSQRTVLAGMIGHPIPSVKQLTFGEAHRLIDKLQALPDYVAPPVPDPAAPLPQSTVDAIDAAQKRAKQSAEAGGTWSHDALVRFGATLPPPGWGPQQADQLAADFLVELQSAHTDPERVEIAGRIATAVKAGKITSADRDTLLEAYKAADAKRGGRAKAGA